MFLSFLLREMEFMINPTTVNPNQIQLTTLLAFKYFAQAELDVLVLEVGMGGHLLDGTSKVRVIAGWLLALVAPEYRPRGPDD